MTPRDAQIMIEEKRTEKEETMRFYDGLNALLCSVMAEPHRDATKRATSFSAADFTTMKPVEPTKEAVREENPEVLMKKNASTLRLWVAHTGGQLNG